MNLDAFRKRIEENYSMLRDKDGIFCVTKDSENGMRLIRDTDLELLYYVLESLFDIIKSVLASEGDSSVQGAAIKHMIFKKIQEAFPGTDPQSVDIVH